MKRIALLLITLSLLLSLAGLAQDSAPDVPQIADYYCGLAQDREFGALTLCINFYQAG
jgi:hypothetical protein